MCWERAASASHIWRGTCRWMCGVAVKEYLPRYWGTRRGDGTVGPRTGSDIEDYRWGLVRFLEEARILARFDHRHLVRVYRVFELRGTAYMVMEYVEGRTLEEELEASGPLSERRVRELLAKLMEGLEEVHEAEVWHRDIKPKNVMVRADGTPVLIDFGAARQAMGGHSGSLSAVLTPGYAPFEQYRTRGHQGPWTDIYALGAVAYWALSGEVPEDALERVQADRMLPVAPSGAGAGERASGGGGGWGTGGGRSGPATRLEGVAGLAGSTGGCGTARAATGSGPRGRVGDCWQDLR